MPAQSTTIHSISAEPAAAWRRAAQLGYQLVPILDGEGRDSGVPLAATATAA